MPVVIDTNVLVAANGRDCPQATPACQLACIQQLRHTQAQDVLVIDDRFLILLEYQHKVSPSGQPGVGDAFLKWVLTNQGNPSHCQQVSITPTAFGSFEEFPADVPALQDFDPSDHKFVAVSRKHPEHPPILNAVDSDWLHHATALSEAGVTVQQLCPDTLKTSKTSGMSP
jgi:hypothetical protein